MGGMFLRAHERRKDGKEHTYWSLVETVRTGDGPRQRTLCYLGELNSSAQARWLKTIEVFNEQGEKQQLRLFPSDVETVGGRRRPVRPFGIRRGARAAEPGATGAHPAVRSLLAWSGTLEASRTGPL